MDTIRGDFSEEKCNDCGKIGCCFNHWGPLVVPGEKGSFCWFCWFMRQSTNKGKPLGVKPPMEVKELRSSSLKVITISGSIYNLKQPNKEGLRSISCNKHNLGFSLCKILLLEIGRSFCFWEYNIGNESKGWSSSLVVKIE